MGEDSMYYIICESVILIKLKWTISKPKVFFNFYWKTRVHSILTEDSKLYCNPPERELY